MNVITDFNTTNLKQNDVPYSDYFCHIGNIHPDVKEEKLLFELNSGLRDEPGLVYLLLLKDKVVKIGCTTVTMKKRIQSYNCGKKIYRDRGTCSTTNYFVLQSLLSNNETIQVFGYYPPRQTVNVFSTELISTANPKLYEKAILTILKEEKKMPILNIQT